MEINKIYNSDCLQGLRTLPNNSIDCVITSPPYWNLRDYQIIGQFGLEPTFEEYINKLCDIFDEVKRVLKKEGTCWINLGDSYGNSSKAGNKLFGNPEFNKNRPSRELTKTPEKSIKGFDKSLLQIPSRFGIEMSNRGWILRNKIIWEKSDCMPESVKDRFTHKYEEIFFFVKNKIYFFEQQFDISIEKQSFTGRTSTSIKYDSDDYSLSPQHLNNTVGKTYPYKNKRTIWKTSTAAYKEAHFATFPIALIEPMVKAGCPDNGIILDPFMGAGTVAIAALKHNKNYIGFELNPEYCIMAENRIERFKKENDLDIIDGLF